MIDRISKALSFLVRYGPPYILFIVTVIILPILSCTYTYPWPLFFFTLIPIFYSTGLFVHVYTMDIDDRSANITFLTFVGFSRLDL